MVAMVARETTTVEQSGTQHVPELPTYNIIYVHTCKECNPKPLPTQRGGPKCKDEQLITVKQNCCFSKLL